MFEKPNLSNAQIIKLLTKGEFLNVGISPSMVEYLLKCSGKECNTGDIGIGSRFKILGHNLNTDYYSVCTEGTSNSLSLFRLVGGCNNLSAFTGDDIEKSEDYDTLSPESFLDLSSDYETALSELLNQYTGKTLRVVARTAEETAPFGRRYYVFVIEY